MDTKFKIGDQVSIRRDGLHVGLSGVIVYIFSNYYFMVQLTEAIDPIYIGTKYSYHERFLEFDFKTIVRKAVNDFQKSN